MKPSDIDNFKEEAHIPVPYETFFVEFTDEIDEEGRQQYYVYYDAPLVVENYILNTTNKQNLENVINLATRQLAKVREESNNIGRASEWDVLGDK